MMTSEAPFFSVCIPNFNYDRFVGRTIESVLSQSFTDFEVIVVDNASEDDSWQIIQKFSQRDSRMRSFKNNYNVGFAPNLQKATEKAVGQFVILLSSDDLMHPEALATYHSILVELENLEKSRVVIHSAYHVIDANDNFVHSRYNIEGCYEGFYTTKREGFDGPLVIRQDPIGALQFALETNKGIAAFMTTCYSRKLWEEVEGYDTQYQIFPDKAFLFKLLLRKPTYIYVNKPLFGYRIHNNNQLAKDDGMGALRHQADGYLRSTTLSNLHLQILGLTRKEVQRFFVLNLCVRHAYIALNNDSRLKAFRILCYAYATYPGISVRIGKLWLLKLFLLMGSPGAFLFRVVYARIGRRDHRLTK